MEVNFRKLGTKVASEKVTLIDDGSIRDGWGSGYIDDEGELTRKNVLIKDGILKNYLVDRLNGKKLGTVCKWKQSPRELSVCAGGKNE